MPKLSPASLAAATQRFHENFEQRGELGASVSVWQDGVEVLGLASGYCDREQTRPWTSDTLVPVWSATKGPAVVTCLTALEEAGVPLANNVAEVWPEFGSADKAEVTFRHLLSHSAGLCALDERVQITDYPAVIRALEQQTPLWTPGTRQGYHARTFGFLLDEIVRRLTTAPSLGELFNTTIRHKLDSDAWIGLAETEDARVARLYPGRISSSSQQAPFMKAFNTPGSLTQRTFASPAGLNGISDFNQPQTWREGFASMGGVASAHGLGRFYAMLAQGGRWRGQQVVPERVLELLTSPLSQQEDAVLCTPIAFAAGMMMDPLSERADTGHVTKLRRHFGSSLTAFGHPGAGGSLAFADPENGIAFAYVMNQMEPGALPGEKSIGIVERLYGLV